MIGYADANGNATFGRYTSLDLLDATTLALIAEIPRTKDPRLNWTLDDSTSEDIELASRRTLVPRVTRSCGSDTPRSPRPESCCSHGASAPAATRTSFFVGSLPATAFTSTPWTRHRAAPSPPTGRRGVHKVSRHDGRQLRRLPVRAPSAVPEVPRSLHDESSLADARQAVHRAVGVTPRMLRH